ncbi:hypothetical protein HII31_00067 [Pseudocercospora fuligena]|uniref:Uncharacterized protein n=1 Tax=Pseudocercospora fuligena TaxID=685502 RepID=A0A8H6VN06_9PEZI|nr:hypothetical protein HII31_00067 [Pseudocercospora fuligena]
MKRITKKYLACAQVSTFAFLLCLILFMNLQPVSSSGKSFAWGKVRYRSSTTFIPDSRGICPELSKYNKPALVIARVKEDGDDGWLLRLADKYHLCTYTADRTLDASSTTLQIPQNRGHESMTYLTFLIDNYRNIPAQGAVFVHGNRFAWHNDAPDYDNADLLRALNVSRALEPYGYHNLRCDWSASTCPIKEALPQRSFETRFTAKLQPYSQRAVSDAALPGALEAIFGGETTLYDVEQVMLGRSDAVRAQCCAQFVVSRERIWQHSREEYIALRQWLLEAAPADDKISGRILSYIWHILFLAPATGDVDLAQLNSVACPSAAECYCRLYGRCELQCEKPDRCRGQYAIPKGYRLPDKSEQIHAGLV